MAAIGARWNGPGRRRFVISLRVLMLAVLGTGLVLGWKVNRARTQVRAVARIKALGGAVYYNYVSTKPFPARNGGKPWGPAWLRKRVGDEFFQEVTGVALMGRNVTDRDLAVLADLDRLDVLALRGTRQVTDAGLVHVRGLNRLRHVHLMNTRVTARGLAHLASLPGLESLQVLGEPVTDDTLVQVGRMRSLRSLRLARMQVTPAGLAHLKRLVALTELAIGDDSVTDEGIVHLASLRRLRSLGLGFSRISDVGLEALRGLSDLESLDLTGVADLTDAGLETVSRFRGLRALKLGGTQVTDAGLRRLERLKGLETLDLSSNQVTDEGLTSLQGLPRLRHVRLDRTGVTDEAIARWQLMNPAISVSSRKGYLAGPMPAWEAKQGQRDEKEWRDYSTAMQEYQQAAARGAPHGPVPRSPAMGIAARRMNGVPGVRLIGFLLGR